MPGQCGPEPAFESHIVGSVCMSRYFIVPFMLVMLHMEPLRRWQLATIGTIFAIINAVTIWTFVFDPFTAPDGSVGRFMW